MQRPCAGFDDHCRQDGLSDAGHVGAVAAGVDATEPAGQDALGRDGVGVAGDRIVECEERGEDAGDDEDSRHVVGPGAHVLGHRGEEHAEEVQVRWVKACGKRCSRIFARKAHDEEYEGTQMSMARRFEVHDPSENRVTLRELYPRWIVTKANGKPKTVQGYESTWRNVVGPRWGDAQLRSITMAEVKVWAVDCSSTTGTTLGATKAREAYFLLCMILDFAIEDGSNVKNPARPSTGSTKSPAHSSLTELIGTDRNCSELIGTI